MGARIQKTAALAVIAIASVPAGLALGESISGVEDQPPEGEVQVDPAYQPDPNPGADVPPDAENATSYTVIPEKPLPAAMMRHCQRVLEQHPEDQPCRVVTAGQSGKIPPGLYTESEIDQELAEAER